MCVWCVQLFLDGVEVKLPQLEGVVVLNINSWSAGCTMWTDSECVDGLRPARMDDHLLEVAGVYSSLHVGRIQVSMATPIRLGQARNVKVWIYPPKSGVLRTNTNKSTSCPPSSNLSLSNSDDMIIWSRFALSHWCILEREK